MKEQKFNAEGVMMNFGLLLLAVMGQGLTLVHFSAQPKPFWSHLTVSPCLIDWGKIMHPTHPTKCAYVEPESGRVQAPVIGLSLPALLHFTHTELHGRGLHSFRFQLNLSPSVHRVNQFKS